MKILSKHILIEELKEIVAGGFGDLVKAVVDIDRKIVAVDAELHSDLEALLLENGSKQSSLWGVNFYPEMLGEDFLEFDSMINVRPSQGNKTRNVDDIKIREKIKEVVDAWVKR